MGESDSAVPALIGLGIDAFIEKNLDRATDYLKKAQVLDPTKSGSAMMWMAVIRQQQRKAVEAESLFHGALAVQDPNSLDAAVTMDLYARFMRNENREDEAAAMQERAGTIRKARIPKFEAKEVIPVHRIGGGVSPPTLLFKVGPAYSEEARVAKLQGTSVLSVEIGPDGVAHNAQVARWLGLGLDEKAIDAVRAWRFKPGMKDGQAVLVRATIEVNFLFEPRRPPLF